MYHLRHWLQYYFSIAVFSVSCPVASTPPPYRTVCCMGMQRQTQDAGPVGPLHLTRMQWKRRMTGKKKEGELDLGWMESALIKSTWAAKCIRFIHSSVACWLGNRSHIVSQTRVDVRLKDGPPQAGCVVCICEKGVERWSEWLHQVLIYYDNTCTQSIKNYLGTEHWPLSNK